MKFRKKILEINPNITDIPRGYKRIGDKIILRHKNILTNDLGIAIMKAYPWCNGVFQHINTVGENRKPKIIHLAGDENTIVEHHENGVTYILDFGKITFSGGNRHLRERLVNLVKPNEFLVDMFAAVGNLSLQVIHHKKIPSILIEKDPYTYQFLEKTIEKNKIKNTLIINDDCRNINFKNKATRIFMGYHNVNITHLKAAVNILKNNGFIHVHPLSYKNHYNQIIEKYTNWFDKLDVQNSIIMINKIKNYSPNLHHIEIIYKINKR